MLAPMCPLKITLILDMLPNKHLNPPIVFIVCLLHGRVLQGYFCAHNMGIKKHGLNWHWAQKVSYFAAHQQSISTLSRGHMALFMDIHTNIWYNIGVVSFFIRTYAWAQDHLMFLIRHWTVVGQASECDPVVICIHVCRPASSSFRGQRRGESPSHLHAFSNPRVDTPRQDKLLQRFPSNRPQLSLWGRDLNLRP